MSTKKKAHSAMSDVPDDGFTWSDGSNYGLDGFYHTQTMGEGVENHGDTSGLFGDDDIEQAASLSDLPDDVLFTEDQPDISFVDEDPLQVVEDGFDLSTMLSEDEGALGMTASEKEAASLANLDWLDPTQKQDPERLPKELRPDQPPLNSIPELEQAWGVDRRTDGVSLVPNKDREIAQYEESIKGQPPATPGAQDEGGFREAMMKAARRVHYGDNPVEIQREFVAQAGSRAARALPFLQRLRDDHGLAGKVFVRASVFPGLKSGKWVDELKKVAKTAKYVITDDPTIATRLGMVAVSEVPWDEALAYYTPRLRAAGFKVAGGNPKEVLRRAFLAGPAAPSPSVNVKPIDVRPADTITAKAARTALAQAPKAVRPVLSFVDRGELAKRKKVLEQIAEWVRLGKIAAQDSMRLQASVAPALDIMQAANALVMAPGPGATYSGVGTKMSLAAQAQRSGAWQTLETKEREVEAGVRARVRHLLARHIKSGNLRPEEVRKLLAMDLPLAQFAQAVAHLVQGADQLRTAELPPAQEAKPYTGPEFRPAAQRPSASVEIDEQNRQVLAAAKASGIRAAEFQKLLRWARQQMTEGLMGRDLDQMFLGRWGTPLLKAASGMIKALREAHEGLAGNIYVDAEAYASPTGAKGCDEGALKHRANTIKTVLAMPRCAECVHVRDMGGLKRCSVYNKMLVDAPPVDDPKAFQRHAIRLANASDAEVTASLFDPSEFSLQSQLDGSISLDDLPDTEALGEVLFGGLSLEE